MNRSIAQLLEENLRTIPNFPKEGVMFKDISSVLMKPVLSRKVLRALCDAAPVQTDLICGIESRGFLFGQAMALELGVPFIPIRKKGKLPGEKFHFAYELEYGTAVVEIHKNDIKAGQKVLIHDDLLATGGSAAAAANLVDMCQAEVVGFSFIIELLDLKGRKNIQKITDEIVSLLAC